jgi:hypothetical protein
MALASIPLSVRRNKNRDKNSLEIKNLPGSQNPEGLNIRDVFPDTG